MAVLVTVNNSGDFFLNLYELETNDVITKGKSLIIRNS